MRHVHGLGTWLQVTCSKQVAEHWKTTVTTHRVRPHYVGVVVVACRWHYTLETVLVMYLDWHMISQSLHLFCAVSVQTESSVIVVFGRPFVKRFVLCYRTVVYPVLLVCLSICLSVTLLYCGQRVGRIQMKLSKQVGLGPGHIVLDGDPGPPLPKGHSRQFSAHICCGQMAPWITIPLSTEVGLDPGDFVFWGWRSWAPM